MQAKIGRLYKYTFVAHSESQTQLISLLQQKETDNFFTQPVYEGNAQQQTI